MSFPDPSGFFVSASGGADTLGVRMMRVWREGDASAASWREDLFRTGDKRNEPMRLGDLVPLVRVPFYSRHLPAPQSQRWYQSRFRLHHNPATGVAVPPSSALGARHASHATDPASPYAYVASLKCADATRKRTTSSHARDFEWDSFAWPLKYSVGEAMLFGESVTDGGK